MNDLRTQLTNLAAKLKAEESGMKFDSGHCESEIFAARLQEVVNEATDESLAGSTMDFLAVQETNQHVVSYTQALRKTLVDQGLVVPPRRASPRAMGR